MTCKNKFNLTHLVCTLTGVAVIGFGPGPGSWPGSWVTAAEAFASTTTDQRCEKVVEAYGACHSSIQFDKATSLVSISPYQSRVECSDGLNLSFIQRLDRMDVASMLSIPYTSGSVPLPTKTVDSDGGRLRFDPIFFEVYGKSASEVQAHLVPVHFLNQVVRFNGQNGAANALSAVNRDLMNAIKTDSNLKSYLKFWLDCKEDLNTMTFAWRKVAGTNRLSNHSFGSAIDLNDPRPKGPVYWLWDLAAQRQREIAKKTGHRPAIGDVLKSIREEQSSDFHPTSLSPVPARLIEIFEAHAFIWGGKWYHFDGMHFEYRPEFFVGVKPACHAPKLSEPLWAPSDEPALSARDPETQFLMENYHWD